MSKKIGDTFLDELKAAGVSYDGYSWGEDGVFEFRDDVPQSVKNQVMNVYKNHDPTKKLIITLDQKLKNLGLTKEELKQILSST